MRESVRDIPLTPLPGGDSQPLKAGETQDNLAIALETPLGVRPSGMPDDRASKLALACPGLLPILRYLRPSLFNTLS